MLVSKLWNNENEAVADALACVMTVKAQGGDVGEDTVNTLRAMLRLEPKIEDHMNKAIEEQYENERQAKKEKCERFADYSDQEAQSE